MAETPWRGNNTSAGPLDIATLRPTSFPSCRHSLTEDGHAIVAVLRRVVAHRDVLGVAIEVEAVTVALRQPEVRDIDAAFGQMLADLDRLGIANKTAIVFVADHGEELFERGGIGHVAAIGRRAFAGFCWAGLAMSREGEIRLRSDYHETRNRR